VTPWRVALTFDVEHSDRPSTPGGTDRLLDALAAADVTATLFVQGRWAEAEPATAARIGSSGHLIGSHSHYHVRMTLLTDAGIAEDLRDAQAALSEACGTETRPWFRCPFGAGADDPRVLAAVAAAGYRDVGWDVDGEDWRVARDAEGLETDIVAGTIARGDGAVVLLHGWPDPTPVALPGIVARLRGAGAAFVRIDELLAA